MARARMLGLCAALALASGPLAGCALIARIEAPATKMQEGKSYLAAEGLFDAAVVTADRTIDTGLVPAASVKALRGYVDTGYGVIKAGRLALAAGNAANLAQAAADLTALVSNINALVGPAPATK